MGLWGFMSFSTGYLTNYVSYAKFDTTKRSNQSFIEAKNSLKSILFKPSVSKNVSFGWSTGLTKEQEQILDVLTDPSNKTAIVAAHTRPDGDAYGSCLGIAGILETLGTDVLPCIDDKPLAKFSQMPSAMENLTATEYINNAKKTRSLIHIQKIKNIDVAVITDTAVPERTTDRVIDLLSKAGKIIIIDHHPDMAGEKTNKQQWLEVFKKRDVDTSNVLYWREHRESACEMIGELDQEVEKEAKTDSLPHYDPDYYKGYRLATAGGITTDVGCIPTEKGQVGKTVLFRLSKKRIQAENGQFQSITRNMFNWLINNCGIKKKDISLKATTRISLPKKLDKHIDNIINGKNTVPGIIVKTATKADPLAFVYIDDNSHLEEIALEANAINGNDALNSRSIYLEMKKRIEEEIVISKNTGVMMIVSKNKRYNSISGSIRSYGYNAMDGEGYIPGHVFTDKLATTLINKLKAKNLLAGGGHENACGFRLTDNVDFLKDVLPEIKTIVQQETQGKDLTVIPEKIGQLYNIHAKVQKNLNISA